MSKVLPLPLVLAETATIIGNIRETFFFNQMRLNHDPISSSVSDFVIDDMTFEVGGRNKKQKQIEKDEKRMDELDRLFRKIYEDNVSGKLNDERFYKLSDGYEAEQGQLKREIEALTAEVSQADMEVTNVAKLIAVTKKYTRIDELTPEILNAFVDKIVIHEREKKDGKRTQQIDIYYSYVGIVDIPTDEEMREMEREYMQRTTRQTA